MHRLATALLLSALAVPALAAEFGDHCTTGLSTGAMMQTDCSVKAQHAGKTYCFSNAAAKATFMAAPDKVIAKAAAFYAKNEEPQREKISQEEALRIVKQKNCDLSNKDVGYLEFNGMDLRHCKMVNTSFFGAYLIGANLFQRYGREISFHVWCQILKRINDFIQELFLNSLKIYHPTGAGHFTDDRHAIPCHIGKRMPQTIHAFNRFLHGVSIVAARDVTRALEQMANHRALSHEFIIGC